MKYLNKHLDKVSTQVASASRTVLFLDYDGTLTPIVRYPKDAVLTKKRREYLQTLSRKKNIDMVIVTGRTHRQIQSFVGISGITYASSHGLVWKKGKRMYKAVTLSKDQKSVLNSITDKLVKIGYNTLTTRKPYSCAFHYRNVSDTNILKIQRQFRKAISPYKKTKQVKVLHGKKIYEVIPLVHWNKGSFCKHYLNTYYKNKNYIAVYIGDDRTDEDAFRILSKAVTIRVGYSQYSAARWYVRSVKEVYQALSSLTNYPHDDETQDA